MIQSQQVRVFWKAGRYFLFSVWKLNSLCAAQHPQNANHEPTEACGSGARPPASFSQHALLYYRILFPCLCIWFHLSSLYFLSLLSVCQCMSRWRWPFRKVIEKKSCSRGCPFQRAWKRQEVKSESETILQKHIILGSFGFFSLFILMNLWNRIFLTL